MQGDGTASLIRTRSRSSFLSSCGSGRRPVDDCGAGRSRTVTTLPTRRYIHRHLQGASRRIASNRTPGRVSTEETRTLLRPLASATSFCPPARFEMPAARPNHRTIGKERTTTRIRLRETTNGSAQAAEPAQSCVSRAAAARVEYGRRINPSLLSIGPH